MATLAQRLQAEIDRANETTSKADTTVHNAIGSLIEGYGQGGVEKVTWHQCPEAVRNYLDSVTYDPDDYSTSRIAEFAPATAVLSNTKPIGKTVDGVTYYNEIPNVDTPFASENTAGTVKPLDRLRWINTPKAINVRDLGGWVCDGGTVRYGKLFRGGEVTNHLDLDVLINQLGIRAELDLQGTAGASVSVITPYVDYCCPQSGENWALYTIANKEQMREAFAFIFDSVKHNKPLYFHCTYGADRTGTIACIIESLLGVSRSDIDKDWELTSFYAERNRADSSYGRLWRGLLKEISDIPGTTWNEKTANYIASLGFTADEINAFRSDMIDGNPSTLAPNISTFSVINNLTHVSNDNPSTTATEYQPYQATVTAETGYVISAVQVLMDDVDVTKDVFSGEKTNLYRSVEKTLSHCVLNNHNTSVIDGQSYAAEVTIDDGYTFDTVQITMDGLDITEQVWITKEDA